MLAESKEREQLAKAKNKVKALGKSGFGKARGFFDDFKAFLNRGNVVDLAVGIIIGAAFSAIVNSLVADIIGPILGLMGTVSLEEIFVVMRYKDKIDEHNGTHYATRKEAKDKGAITLNYGNFFQTIINFLMIAFCVFLLVKLVYFFYHKEAAVSTDWPCPKCKENVKDGAIRCPHCTAEPIRPEDAGEE